MAERRLKKIVGIGQLRKGRKKVGSKEQAVGGRKRKIVLSLPGLAGQSNKDERWTVTKAIECPAISQSENILTIP